MNQGHLKVTVQWERKECKVCFTDVQVEFQDEIILKDWYRKHPKGYKTYGKDTALYLWTGFTPLTTIGMFREYQVQIKWSDPEEKKCYTCIK